MAAPRVCVQWTLQDPPDWIDVEARDWSALPTKPLPRTTSRQIDDQPGWVHRLCVQGIEFAGDHYAVEEVDGETTRVTIWNDDPADYPVGERFAQVWTIKTLAPDPELGGAINTRQSQIVYLDLGDALHTVWTVDGPIKGVEFRDWSDFIEPIAAITKHGIWVNTQQNLDHESKYTTRSWREWTDRVPEDQIDSSGRVRQMRPQGKYKIPDGTITYFQRDTDLATGIHAAVDVASENELNSTAGTGQTEASGNLGGAESGILFVFTTQSGAPNVGDWPSGDYRCQLDVSAVGANITFGARAAGSATGHFARVNSGLTSDLQTWAQTESLFSGTGLHLATTGTIDPSAGAAGDRWEIAIAGTRPASHSNQALTLTFDSDAFADGPWSAGDHTVDAAGATGTASAQNATVSIGTALTVSAQDASGTASAQNTTVANSALTVNAQESTGTASAQNATVANAALQVNAGNQIAAASAQSATVVNVSLQANAENPIGTAGSQNATVSLAVSLTVNAQNAIATAGSQSATVIKSISADAQNATGTTSAQNATVVNSALTVDAQNSVGTVSAQDATVSAGVSLTVNAQNPIGTASSQSPTVEKNVNVSAQNSVGTASAQNATVSPGSDLTAVAQGSTGTASAQNPTVSPGSNLTAVAQVAISAASAQLATVSNTSLTVTAQNSIGNTSAQNATVVNAALQVAAQNSTAIAGAQSPTVVNQALTAVSQLSVTTASAQDATVASEIVADAQVATGTASAQDATITNVGLTANAQNQSATVAAQNAIVVSTALQVVPQPAQGEIESSDAGIQLQAINTNAQNSVGTASAQNATVQIESALSVTAEAAIGTVSGQNATAQIVPVVAVAGTASMQADSLIAHALIGDTLAGITKASVATVSQLFTSVSKGPTKISFAQGASTLTNALAATVIKPISVLAVTSIGTVNANPANVFKDLSLIVDEDVRINSIVEDVSIEVGIDEDVVVQSINEDVEV